MEPNTLRRVLSANGFKCTKARKDQSWTATRQVMILSQARTFDVAVDVTLDERTEKFQAQITATEDGKVSQGVPGDLGIVMDTVLGFVARANAM